MALICNPKIWQIAKNLSYIEIVRKGSFYYRWGNEEKGFVSIATYDKDEVLKYCGEVPEDFANHLPFHNPYN